MHALLYFTDMRDDYAHLASFFNVLGNPEKADRTFNRSQQTETKNFLFILLVHGFMLISFAH